VTVDTFLGAPYTYLDTKIDFKFEGPFRSFSKNVDEDKSCWEPLVGVRTIWDFYKRWALSLAGNIGGVAFGSDFAWSASGLIGYQFSLIGEDNARAFAGYRALSQDYTDGSGNDKFEWDVTLGRSWGWLFGFSSTPVERKRSITGVFCSLNHSKKEAK
jgi:hypothetical protein